MSALDGWRGPCYDFLRSMNLVTTMKQQQRTCSMHRVFAAIWAVAQKAGGGLERF